MKIIQKVRKIVKDAAKSKSNYFGVSAWDYHILSVVKFAKILGKKKNQDLEMIELAALLHDYASIKDKSLYSEHHKHGTREAQKILENLNYSQEKIDIIKDAIYSHRGSRNIKKKTEIAQILADADSMAHFTEIYDLLHFAYATRKMSVAEGRDFVRDKLARSWKKLSPDAKKLIKVQYDAAKVILK